MKPLAGVQRPEPFDAARPVAVLIHGFTGDATTMAQLAADLAPIRQTLCVDLPGHGNSPGTEADSTAAATIERLASLLDEHGLDQVDLVGYSLGGRVALSFAVARPDRVRSLSLIGATAGLADPEAAAERRAADERLAASLDAEGVEAFIDRWMALPMWRSLERRIGPEAWAASRRQRVGNTADGLASSLRSMGTGAMPALHGDLDAMTVPTLLIAGDEDEKFAAIARDMHASMPASNVALIAAAGHAAHLEQPESTATAIRAHLARVDR